MFTATDIIRTASRTLFDEDHVRWTLPELLDHINDAVRTIVAVKPNARTETLTIYLAAGTLQELPEAYTVLARVSRNMVTGHDEVGGPVGGSAIRMVTGRDLMDSFFPGWQADTSLFGPTVQHVIYDDAHLRTFYVIPGNDGTGKVEATVGVMPAAIAPGGDPDLESTYLVAVDLPDKYRSAVADYVCFRAFSKDQGIPTSAQRANSHLVAFQSAIGATGSAESTISAARVATQGGA